MTHPPATAAPIVSASAARTIVLGTHNRKKGDELAALFAPLDLQVVTLADFSAPLAVEETGDSFAANAGLKAVRQAVHLQSWVLGDDSGLVVDALRGAPGIYSARFAGPEATDLDNRRKLLQELAEVPLARRTARFVCHLALADPTGSVVAESSGCCHGRIRYEDAGSSGFGYDPLFEILEYHRTFGELGSAAKSCLSHRARAAAALVPHIRSLVESGRWPSGGPGGSARG